jgi:hypothetical protein
MFAVHGNRLIAHEVFKRLPLANLDRPGLDIGALQEEAKALTSTAIRHVVSAANAVYPDSYLASLFKNLNKCRDIDMRVAALWGGA